MNINEIYEAEKQALATSYNLGKGLLELKLKAALEADIPWKDIITYSTGGIGFGWTVDKMTTSQVLAIVKAFPVNGPNHSLKYATKDPDETDSPVVLKWNSKNTKEVKICYPSGGIPIQITVDIDFFKKHKMQVPVYSPSGKTIIHYLTKLYPFPVKNYYGNNEVMYFLDGAESHLEWTNFAFTGVMAYEDEISEKTKSMIIS